jgi:predicted O-methyltransferase YrrM
MKTSILSEINLSIFNNENQYIYGDEYLDLKYPHTNLKSSFCNFLLNEFNPKFYIEIGSMLGGSALVMAEESNKIGIPLEILCIDPFTGDVNMWEWENNPPNFINNDFKFLKLENGEPTIRKRFLANVKHFGFEKQILPIQATGIVGLRLIKRLYENQKISLLPDMIYLDSAHEKDETYIELKSALDVLSDSGIIVGDDWGWEAVRNDVNKFHIDNNLNLGLYDNGQWILSRKT